MPLTDASIRAAKPQSKPARLFDSAGLYLEIAPSGGKWWRFKYRINGKEKRLSLGVYPDVPLAGRRDTKTGQWIEGARDKRDGARQLLARGIDPGEHRKSAKRTKHDFNDMLLRDHPEHQGGQDDLLCDLPNKALTGLGG